MGEGLIGLDADPITDVVAVVEVIANVLETGVPSVELKTLIVA